MMQLHSIGVGFEHDENFFIERPEGSGDNLLVIFKSPAKVLLGGEWAEVAADSALLFKRGTPQRYGPGGGRFINHWVHMECNENDVFHLNTRLPFEVPVKLNSTDEIENILHMIVAEEIAPSGSGEYMDLLLKLLLMKTGLCRADDDGSGSDTTGSSPYYSVLKCIRAELYTNAGRYSSVDELAARASLSPSYFHRLYKKQFGVSCYEDLLSARIRAAQNCLANTSMTIREIAHWCGYENEAVFMRMFRLRTGLRPSEYRRAAELKE